MNVMGWRPKRRNVRYQPKPDFVPEWIYVEALGFKRAYNENWEFWVYKTSLDYNCSMALAEDACIRGIKKSILQLKLVFGPKVGDWFEQFLEMGDIFDKVKHPEYQAKLTPLPESKIIVPEE